MADSQFLMTNLEFAILPAAKRSNFGLRLRMTSGRHWQSQWHPAFNGKTPCWAA